MTYSFEDLIIEITRRCNLNCDHCLRGPQQNIDISDIIIDNFLDKITYIGTLTFSGGEPMLAPNKILYIIDGILKRRISIGSFFMATNGTVFDEKVFLKLIELYWYCEEPDLCAVSVSVDNYHEWNDQTTVDTWKVLNFYSDIKERPYNWDSIISEGNAAENGIGKRSITFQKHFEGYEFDKDSIWFEGDFYLNVLGDVTCNCDMSYESQNEYKIGNISDGTLENVLLKESECEVFHN